MPSVYNNNIQIVQNQDYVVILSEMVHDARIIPLRGGARLSDDIGLWSGDSRGRWEGSTLVIETRNFNGLTQSFAGYGSSRNKLLVERLTKAGPRSISYEYTITDPDTFSEPVSVILPLTSRRNFTNMPAMKAITGWRICSRRPGPVMRQRKWIAWLICSGTDNRHSTLPGVLNLFRTLKILPLVLALPASRQAFVTGRMRFRQAIFSSVPIGLMR